jgi:hypothetical protein
MGRIKPKTASDLMDIANRFVDGVKTRATTSRHDHQKMIGETVIVAKGEDLATMTTTALIVK